jgi:Ca2+-binding EF-hand superfamily protein
MDDDNSRALDMNEFKKAARDYRFDLSDSEVEKAFACFDRDGKSEIDYDEFLRAIRGNMNDFRRRLVDQAYSFMDKDGSGHLDINDIRGTYNAKFHPDVKAGKKTEDEVLLEFLETFEQHHNLLAGQTSDNTITREEWQEYYENVSMSIDDDKYFELMMNNCWRMNENTTYNNNKKGWSSTQEETKRGPNLSEAYQNKNSRDITVKEESKEPMKSTGNVIVDKFRDRLAQRGGRGIIGLARQFKIFDDNNSKSLDFDEFAKAIKDFRVDLNVNEVKVLFGAFDRDGTGSIDYDEFLRTVRGEMNDRRKKVVLQAFDKLDTDKSGIVEVNELKYLFNAKSHPDVKSGKRTEEDVYGEFLETFEIHHNINRGSRDRRVTREEFLEYYNNVSMSIENDDYFDLMIRNAWKLEGNTNSVNQKGWAGDYTEKQQLNPRGGPSGNVFKRAPFGVSDEPTNYATSLRPNTANNQNNFSKKGDETLLKFREKLAARGTRGIMGIRRNFKICDDDNSHTINFDEFSKLIKDYRIALNDSEIKKLYSIFDNDKSGSIDYDEFLRGVVGEMNDNRKNIVTKAFKKLDKNNSGTVNMEDLRGVYNAKNHPDVKAGKKTEDEVLAEFLDNFEYHFSFLVSFL